MYSVVLATMLVAGTAAPDFHGRSGCHSCYGCSCYGGYGGYAGYGHGHGGLFHHNRGCYNGCNCYSSCYSCYSSCYSCYSSCYSCYSSCNGCYSGCYSSCYGGCTVVYSSCVCSSTCCTTGPRVIEVPSKKAEKIDPPMPNPKKTGTEEGVQAKSRVTVTAPTNARVWVDNVECPVRTFETPALNANQQYAYTFRMEMVRDGQNVVQTQRAIITPGQPVNVEFKDNSTATVSR